MDRYGDIMKRSEWYRAARFGMFIHYGAYASAARGETFRNAEALTDEQYMRYVNAFTADKCDMREWARVARAAGMKYAVLTAKHHEGFCLFDSKYTDYKSTNSPAGRDIVREFVEAFRAEGLKVGLYYSLIDWHHPDYPHMTDRHHPMRGNKDYPDEGRNFDNYIKYMHSQVRELLTNYGKIDIVWFDYSYVQRSGEVMSREKWGATELVDMARSLQPGILIDERLDLKMGEDSVTVNTEDPLCGDFRCPEQFVPDKPILDRKGRPFPWETCCTTQSNWHWGYSASADFMCASDAIRLLADCVSKGGNLLLNVGPDGRGAFPAPVKDMLAEVGEWMQLNGDSIYGCDVAPLPRPQYGVYTKKDDKVYLHMFWTPGWKLPLYGIAEGEVAAAHYLADNCEIGSDACSIDMPMHDFAFLRLKNNRSDSPDTVIELKLKK